MNNEMHFTTEVMQIDVISNCVAEENSFNTCLINF